MTIRFSDGETAVQLGDRVSLRVLLRKRLGRVVYVPGISEFNREFEYNGMKWVGIRLTDRSLVATPVLLKSGTLKKKIRFLTRDGSPCELITGSSREFEEFGEGPSV